MNGSGIQRRNGERLEVTWAIRLGVYTEERKLV